jgi:hypothetical protein
LDYYIKTWKVLNDKIFDFMKIMTSEIIYDNKNFDKTNDFMKVLWCKIFIEFMIDDKIYD